MLNLNVEVNIDLQKTKIPIKLLGVNECLHCGSKGTLRKVDIFGRESKQDIYPLDKIKCVACGYDYSIEWKDLDGTGELTPVPVSPSIKQEFINTLQYLKIRNNGKTEI